MKFKFRTGLNLQILIINKTEPAIGLLIPPVLQQDVLVLLGKAGVDPQQVLSVRPSTRTAPSGLDSEDVVQHRAHEVVVQEGASRMAHQEREDGQALRRLTGTAEYQQLRDVADVGKHHPGGKTVFYFKAIFWSLT